MLALASSKSTGRSASPEAGSAASYIDTAHGLFTASGRRFHVTEDALRDYAGEVLDAVSLERLLAWVDTWLRSPATVALWGLLAFLLVLPPLWAGLAAIALYGTWAVLSPSVPSVALARAFGWMQHAVAQGLGYAAGLSVLAAQGQYAAVGAGLAAFVLVRWGVVAWALDGLVRPLQRALYTLPLPDQVLRGFIHRIALSRRLSVPQIDEMTKDVIDAYTASGNDTS